MSQTSTSKASPDVLIIGAGLHGLSAALHLALAGLRPLVLEKDHPGRHASGVNAGGVRRLGRDLAEIPLSVESMKIWHEIEALVDDDCGFARCGQVKIAETESELDGLRQRVEAVRRLGFDHETLIRANELRALVPAIAPHCTGAILCREDGAANPFRTVTAFRRKAEALGAEVLADTPAREIRRTGRLWQVRAGAEVFEAPILINTAGAWGGEIAAQLGEPVPLAAKAPMLMITERVVPFLTPVLGAAGRTLSFKQFANGTVLIGGGHLGQASPETNRAAVRIAGLRRSAETVGALFPQLAEVRVVRFWAGIEGIMPDAIPVIGPSAREENAYHAFGFSAHGFQLGPITGRILTDLVTKGGTDLPIEAFRITRFERAPTGA